MTHEEVKIITSILESGEGWMPAQEIVRKFRRKTGRNDHEKTLQQEVMAAVFRLEKQGSAEVATRRLGTLFARTASK